ncbi:MAG: glycosyltransferase [Planctomycetota bacterium]
MQNKLPKSEPRISVLVPTHGRPDRIGTLIDHLKRQTTPAADFEVIIVDDGGDPPVDLDIRELPFACTVMRRRNGGPAAARNAGLALTAAPLVLILNDDAVPATDLIERHLLAHRNCGPKTAVLGTFHFTEESRRSPFVRVLDETDVLFAFRSLRPGERHNWNFFWTCNISLPVADLITVGGFDEENFDWSICEDVELGLRLEQQGYSVLYDDTCVAHHEHRLTPTGYRDRGVQLGIYQVRMQMKHGEVARVAPALSMNPEELEQQAIRLVEERLDASDAFFARLEEDVIQYDGLPIPADYVETTTRGLQHQILPYWLAGVYRELTGIDPIDLIRNGAPEGISVAIIVASYNGLHNTKRCIESLRAAGTERYPVTIIVVDNGSTDGSAEWLREQSDLVTLFNDANHGAPRARNQGLRLVPEGTDWIAFLDNDVVVPTGWLDRALYHGAVDPRVGSIALCANRASKHQVLPYEGADDIDSINAFAEQHARAHTRDGEDTTLFTSLAVLVRRTAMEKIGGFDETFSPWGFEDDDLALRIRLSGFRNRVAKDTFVFHAAYDGPAKNERHSRWLQQNWDAFLAKWSPGAIGSALFDYSRVSVPQLGQATQEQLYFALPPEGTPAPTWQGMEEGEESDASTAVVEVPQSIPRAVPRAQSGARGIAGDAARPAPHHATPASAANILVMGCGRSGTSMVTGMLADAGWHVGDHPYPGRGANPKGFFETEEINGINEFLLAGAVPQEAPKKRMQHWLTVAPEPLDFDVDSGLRSRIERLADRGPFAYKDPRFCYTLPAWRPSMPDARFVCIFREPSATAASIVKEVADADYMNGCDVDFDSALEVWQSMYRQVLDQHSSEGEWLFLHFDQLFTPEGVERLEAFVGAPVAADFPDRKLKRSQNTEPVSAEVAETYRELCERAAHAAAPIVATPSAPAVVDVADPELTVLICSYQRRDTLLRCLRTFENQTAVGRYEIIVVNDGSTDGTREALDAWNARAPMRVLHRENGGLSAARNSGLEVARGRYVLLVNDDTMATPDLVEKHLAAHSKHGPSRAVLGTFEQPREALDNALMRMLEGTDMVFCYAGLDPNRLHDWTRFWTCNVSVSLEDVRKIGGFDETFRHYGCEDTDLAFRLQTECGTRVVYDPSARAFHEHILTFDDVKRRAHTVASAFVRFFKKHPKARLHPDWRRRNAVPSAQKDKMIISTLPERSRAEAMARELSDINVGLIERAGPEGAEIAQLIVSRLEAFVTELNHLWWLEGELDAEAKGVGLEYESAGSQRPTLAAC